MELPPFADAIARICAADRRYAPDAYLFLNEGLVRTLKQIQDREKNPAKSPAPNSPTACASTPSTSSAPWP
jgi:hypothetical protein